MSRFLHAALLPIMLAIVPTLAAEPTTKPIPPAGNWGVKQVLVGERDAPHILLIGDSILNGYNGQAAATLHGQVSLDVWITPEHVGSKSVPDKLKQICADQSYDLVLFNDRGLHAWQAGRIPEGQYEPLLRAHVADLRKFAPKAKLIFATTTPILTKTKPFALDPERDPIIEQRNQIAIRVMKEENIPVADFYEAVAGRPELSAGDSFHWTKPAYALIAQLAVGRIAEALDLKMANTQPAVSK